MNLSKEFLDAQRWIGDAQADTLVTDALAANNATKIYTLLRLTSSEINKFEQTEMTRFLLSTREQPQWFDEVRILKGQLVFQKYAQEMMTLLGAMSLPYCYAASPGNKALYLSEKMRQSTGKRLIETAAFVINVLTPGSLATEKEGHLHINKTRLIHAVSRYYINKTWNSNWGVPINQEDMAGTNLAFSYIILLGMQQSGFTITDQEKEDFLFTWRYIGYQLHVEEELLPRSFKEAGLLTQLIKQRNFRKTEEGIGLTIELMNYFKSVLPKQQADVIEAQIRYFLGKEISSYIGLEPEPFKDRIVSLVNSIMSLKNMMTSPSNSYEKMMADHVRLRKKFIG